jgi:UbiD family decarboxylase
LNLDELLRYAQVLGKSVYEAGIVKPEYEVTRIGYYNRDQLVLAKVEGIEELPVYVNVMSRREDLIRLLGVKDLEEAYYRVERALGDSRSLEVVEFNGYFEEVRVDLSALPFIKYYEEDGGKYLTSSVYIACYENICNASFHRTMYLSRETATLRIVPRHLYYLISRYVERGRDAPVAMVLGLDPLQELACAMSPPLGVFEVEVGASLGGEHRVVKTPKYNIPVPANASVIVEGVISRELVAKEGPFVDILMLTDIAREQPVFIAERMYISKYKPPTIHATIPGLWEHQLLMGFPREAHMHVELKRVTPCVKAIRLTEGGSMWLHGVIAVSRSCSEGDARLAALAAISAHPSVKHLVVVDDDIDVDDPQMVEWAIATRTKAGEDVIVLRNVRGSTLEPRSRDGIGDKLIILAIAPRNEPFEKYKRVRIPHVPHSRTGENVKW